MKISSLFLLIFIFLTVSVSAQKPLKYKPFQHWQNDSLYSNQLKNGLKNRYQFGEKLPALKVPEKQLLPGNQNLAMVPDSGNVVVHEPHTNMPVLVPKFRSKMPVVKPDPNVHYFLKIKKY